MKHPPITPKCPRILHGADYNPDQWLDKPEILEEDVRLMKEAGCNIMAVGIFAWSRLEPEEGSFRFEWLDDTLDRMADNGIFAALATPSGSKPAWMSERYPEVCRMDANGVREPHHRRHNHCPSSPVYREKCREMNERLARRYGSHPALAVWHVSNEYNGGDCHCPHCYEAFRDWLKARYAGDLEALNAAWWTSFWSHRFTDWEHIRPVDPSLHALMLDWKRFRTDQVIDFFRHEAAPLREHSPDIPVTTNFMGFFEGLDYWKLARELDVISWDSYPGYLDRPEDVTIGIHTSLAHDLNRSLKGKPFMLMECTPSIASWRAINKLKRPGMHRREALHALAHGSDTVQYFQWRKGRGGFEKFHGAVIDHVGGGTETRVFREVAEVGRVLASLEPVVGTTSPAEVAILCDWENRWAIETVAGWRTEGKDYLPTCIEHYRPFWEHGVTCDLVSEDSSLDGYRLLIAPMAYMIRPGFAERVIAFVEAGGTFVTTYLSGEVDESDLCFTGGFPGPLRDLLGIWAEEVDVLCADEEVPVEADAGNPAGLSGTYRAREFCERIHAEDAEVLARYAGEFYAGMPAATVRNHGQGRAYYLASRNEGRFQDDFYGRLIDDLGLTRALGRKLPAGVTAQLRTDGKEAFVFILNFNPAPVTVEIPDGDWRGLPGDEWEGPLRGSLELPPHGSVVLRGPARA